MSPEEASTDRALERAFAEHQRLLWSLAYRMLGTPQDADEIVQEAFLRAVRSPPDAGRPLRPWLVRVAVNAARDRLRQRRRRAYVGPWLPAPVEEEPELAPVAPAPDAEAWLARLDELSYGLMVGLEQLTPGQRAVWLLREVMGVSTREAADLLGVRPGSVKVTLHRARRALGASRRTEPDRLAPLGVVAQLAGAILQGDVAAVRALLADDVVAVADGGGVFHAARVPVVGAEAVARYLVGLARKNVGARYVPTWLGAPAVHVLTPVRGAGFAPRSITLFEVEGGRVRAVWSVLAPDKLTGSPPPRSSPHP
jgi:RNA polymerase sigma-70 factor (ECF subfamily)